MIYILGSSFLSEMSELEEVIDIASTNIEDVLEYLYKNVRTDSLTHYTILIKPENSTSFEIITPYINTYDGFVKYTPSLFTVEENKMEFEHVKHQLFHWCNAIKVKRDKELEEARKLIEEDMEKRERELYERLKAKYGD